MAALFITQVLEITMRPSRQKDIHTMSTPYSENEHSTAPGSNAEQKKPDRKEYTPYDSICMKFKHWKTKYYMV